jgi:uncharacterized protein
VLGTIGTQRLRVRQWLADDPFPQAEVELVDDPDEPVTDTAERCEAVGRLLRRVLGMRAELGEPGAGVDFALAADDIARAAYEAAALAPVGPLDAQALLELDDATGRLARLEALLTDEAHLLEFRLSAD